MSPGPGRAGLPPVAEPVGRDEGDDARRREREDASVQRTADKEVAINALRELSRDAAGDVKGPSRRGAFEARQGPLYACDDLWELLDGAAGDPAAGVGK